MAWRLCAGYHPTYGMGCFVSNPGVDVFGASLDQLMMNTNRPLLQVMQSGSFTLNGGGAWQLINFPAVGYNPLILFGNARYAVQYQFLNGTQLQVRRTEPTFQNSNADVGCFYIIFRNRHP